MYTIAVMFITTLEFKICNGVLYFYVSNHDFLESLDIGNIFGGQCFTGVLDKKGLNALPVFFFEFSIPKFLIKYHILIFRILSRYNLAMMSKWIFLSLVLMVVFAKAQGQGVLI